MNQYKNSFSMSKSNIKTFQLPACKQRAVEINFDGGTITSDAGVLFLNEIDRKLGLTEKIAEGLKDTRDAGKVKHQVSTMLKQRVFAIALGYEDLNDHEDLRHDIAIQTSVKSDEVLASSSTLCRFENKADGEVAIGIHKVIIEQFIASFEETPKEIILDFDATDDIIHGNQIGRFYHGYYGNYCFLPLHVFCGSQLLVSYLRPSNRDGARHSWAILSLLVKRLRQSWPEVKIIFRGDSGFCRHQMLSWCDKVGVYYITGIAGNNRLDALFIATLEQAQAKFNDTKIGQKHFSDFQYAATTWKKECRIIGKAEVTERGSNTRFIVTNLIGESEHLYSKVYCARGNMENRIKEIQLELFSDRTSCHQWWSNQFRLLLSSLAYILLERLRAITLQATEFANSQANTLRLRLLKIGGVIVRNTRTIRFILSSQYRFKELFFEVVKKLVPT